LKKYRRIEVNAYGGRVTILSDEWPRDLRDALPSQNDDVSLADSEACQAVEPDSAEGQRILVEAVRSLEQCLSPEARATIWADQQNLDPKSS